MLLTDEPEKQCYPLDCHLLCLDCHMHRLQSGIDEQSGNKTNKTERILQNAQIVSLDRRQHSDRVARAKSKSQSLMSIAGLETGFRNIVRVGPCRMVSSSMLAESSPSTGSEVLVFHSFSNPFKNVSNLSSFRGAAAFSMPKLSVGADEWKETYPTGGLGDREKRTNPSNDRLGSEVGNWEPSSCSQVSLFVFPPSSLVKTSADVYDRKTASLPRSRGRTGDSKKSGKDTYSTASLSRASQRRGKPVEPGGKNASNDRNVGFSFTLNATESFLV